MSRMGEGWAKDGNKIEEVESSLAPREQKTNVMEQEYEYRIIERPGKLFLLDLKLHLRCRIIHDCMKLMCALDITLHQRDHMTI